jgi:hypothetical protein
MPVGYFGLRDVRLVRDAHRKSQHWGRDTMLLKHKLAGDSEQARARQRADSVVAPPQHAAPILQCFLNAKVKMGVGKFTTAIDWLGASDVMIGASAP